MTMQRQARWPSLGVVLVGCAVVAGCATVGGPPEVGVSPSEQPFLLPPYQGWSGTLAGDAAAQLQRLYTGLVEGDAPQETVGGAFRLLESDPGLAPAKVVAAQARHLDGRYEQALELLTEVLEAEEDYTAASLIYGRVAEKLGLTVEAYAGYEAVREESAAAARRAEALRPTAVDEVARQFEEQLAAGRQEAAAKSLERLRRWAPESERTRAAVAAFGAATADPLEQLARLRNLSGSNGTDVDLTRRRAELEIEVGDAAVAVRLAENLLAGTPNDLYTRHLLERARFQWRLNLLPSEVRSLERRPELTRGEFAVLLYWLFPQVRYGQPAQARIATDVIDHPQSEAIVRVINLGLMDVDAQVHRFAPEVPVTRLDALRALLRLLDGAGEGGRCLGETGVPAATEYLCRAAVSCRLLPEAEDCLPDAKVSGVEALEMARGILLQLPTS